ncbi:MAG: hypothetical protein ABJL67_09260 [Sulfitobacter sp.]
MSRTGILLAVVFTTVGSASSTENQAELDATLIRSELAWPITEIADSDLVTCAHGKVAGLKADGDGFLSVRSGSGSKYKKLDEVHNDDELWLFEEKGDWVDVILTRRI